MAVVVKLTDKEVIHNAFADLLQDCISFSVDRNKKIKKAFQFANEAHKNMRRRSGEPYILHPIAVAKIVVNEIGLGSNSVIAALLHDVVEDTDFKIEDIDNLFGPKIAQLVDGLTKIADVFDQTKSIQAENFRKMLFTLSDDLRVILIKLADRLHNMRTLDTMPLRKQIKIADETLFIFSPLAHRMGLYQIKTELENLSLKSKNPQEYSTIAEKIIYYEDKTHDAIRNFVAPISAELKKRGFKFSFTGRPKSIYSIWSKIHNKNISLDEIYDRLGTRIVFEPRKDISEEIQCWEIYSIITSIYQPHPDRLRDWISSPKTNGYEALHITVMGPNGQWYEIQIRSNRMNEIAEKGLAAHWKYKSNKKHESKIDKWLNDVSEHLKSSDEDALSFLDEFKLNLFIREIQVFTPKGDIHTLPQGATALDFAFKIHTDIGLKCIGAKVNFKLKAASHVLKSGDQVEILTSESQQPKPEWLDFVVTARARSRLKSIFRNERKKSIRKGKKLVDNILSEIKLKVNPGVYKKLLQHFKIQHLDDFYIKVSKNLIDSQTIKKVTKESDGSFVNYWRLRFRRPKLIQDPSQKERKIIKTKDKIQISDEDFLKYKLAPCCTPIPGDAVTSFLDPSENMITIHDQKCSKAIGFSSSQGDQIIDTEWITHRLRAFPATISLNGIDAVGLLNKITQIISQEHAVNIKSLSFESRDGIFEGIITLNIHHVIDLNNLIANLLKLKGLKKVTRL